MYLLKILACLLFDHQPEPTIDPDLGIFVCDRCGDLVRTKR